MDQVLPVADVPYDDSVERTGDISQMSAEEYLSWVRSQSSRLPSFFRASDAALERVSVRPATQTMPAIESISSCPADRLPSLQWEREIIHSFSELRQLIASKSEVEEYRERLVAVPQMKDRQAWLQVCLGPQAVQHSTTATTETEESDEVSRRKSELAADLGISLGEERMEESDGEDEDNADEDDNEEDNEASNAYPAWEGAKSLKPTLKLLLQFDQVLTQKVLVFLVEWLEEHELGDETLTTDLGQWIYGLLARVEKPLHRDIVALIRQLYRRCCKLRSTLDLDSESPILATLNTLISLSGYYFGQGEHYSSFEPIVESSGPIVGEKKPRNLLWEEGSDEEMDDDEEADEEAAEEGEENDGMDEENDEPTAKWRAL